MGWLVVTVLALCVGRCLTEVPPSFSAEEEEKIFVFEVDENGLPTNLTLACEATGDPAPTIAWFREDQMVNENLVQEKGSLLVVNITEGEFASAEGVQYYCTATNPRGTIRSRNITVFYASFGGFIGDPAQPEDVIVDVTVDGDVALLCDVDVSVPPPEIVWYADGTPIAGPVSGNKYYRDGGKYLVILDLADPGDIDVTYRCGVTNARVYDTVESNISYILNEVSSFPEGLFVYKSLENKTGLVGDSIEFTIVVGYGGAGILTYSYEDIEDASGQVTTPLTTLVVTPNNEGLANIVEILDNDIEIYVVEAIVGVFSEGLSRIETVYLEVQAMAAITSPPDNAFNKFTTDTIVFTCETSGRPTPSIQFYFNGVLLEADGSKIVISDSTLTINNASIDDTGMYQCFVQNEINTVQESWALRVREPAAPVITAIQGFNGSALAVDCRVDQEVLSEPVEESTIIEVVVTADPCPSVTWMYNGAEIDFVNNTVQVPPGEGPCHAEQEERPSFTFSLTVSDLTEGEGLYSAVVENRAGSSMSEEVLVTPESNAAVVSLTLLGDDCLREGTTLRLKCETSGYPQPVITFIKGVSGPVDVSGNFSTTQECDELVITDITAEDGGEYGCTANNGAGESDPVDYTAVVCNEATVFGIVADPSDPVAEGDDLTLTCETIGTPDPEVVWQRVNGDTGAVENITATSRFILSGSHPLFRLQIDDVKPEDAGVYRCLAFSVAGSDSQELRVEVDEEDDPVLSMAAIIGVSAGGAGAVLLIVLVLLLLICVYLCARSGHSAAKAISAYPAASAFGDFTDGRGNVDRDSDEEDAGDTEAFDPQYQSLPVLRPPQPPTYKPTPSYYHGENIQLEENVAYQTRSAVSSDHGPITSGDKEGYYDTVQEEDGYETVAL